VLPIIVLWIQYGVMDRETTDRRLYFRQQCQRYTHASVVRSS